MIKEKYQSWGSFLLEIIILLSVVLFIRFYIFQFFRVSGPSMCPTLNQYEETCKRDKGEFIFVNEFLYRFVRAPKFGEIVVFHPPEVHEGQKKVFYIKRVMGVPGDTIYIENGQVYRQNEEMEKTLIDEPYLSAANQGRTTTQRESFTVPEGHVILFGDNRTNSLDSRRCFGNCQGDNTPFVPFEQVTGKAEFTVWPISMIRDL